MVLAVVKGLAAEPAEMAEMAALAGTAVNTGVGFNRLRLEAVIEDDEAMEVVEDSLVKSSLEPLVLLLLLLLLQLPLLKLSAGVVTNIVCVTGFCLSKLCGCFG